MVTRANRYGELGLYVHVPYCRHRCSYCDFYSLTGGTDASFRAVARKLREEIDGAAASDAARFGRRPLKTIFFGGGTPSLLPLDELQAIFRDIEQHFGSLAETEITLEANPETVSVEYATRLLGETPVNRVSLGAQSFNARHLATLERLAQPEDVRTAVRRLQQAGFRRVSVDLIFAIPGQTIEEAIADVGEAIALGVDHASAYQLTLAPGHKLYRSLPSADVTADFYEAVVEAFAQHGLARYEISNFARAGAACLHNELYWQGGDWLAVGPSAAGRFFSDGQYFHRRGPAELERWLRLRYDETPYEAVDRWESLLEALGLELRTAEGLALDAFTARYRCDVLARAHETGLVSGGIVEEKNGRLRCTQRGLLVVDSVAVRLCPPRRAPAEAVR